MAGNGRSGTLVRKAAAPHWRLLRNAAVRNCGPAALSRAWWTCKRAFAQTSDFIPSPAAAREPRRAGCL